MKIIFFGCTNFSKRVLDAISTIENIEIAALFTIPEYFSISYSEKPIRNTNYFDFTESAEKLRIPIFQVDSVEGKKINDYKEFIQIINPDIILVMGWYYMVPKSIRDLAKYGAWGIHASLLPNYAGGAPLVWAIIEGQKKTGVSLFKLSSGVDDGDIIRQKSFSIEETDTIKEVYEKATDASCDILIDILKDGSKIIFYPQDKSKIKIYPQRSPDDGEIDWNWDVITINNFIRAQTKPYPGAWFRINNKKIVIWSADIHEVVNGN